MTNLAETDRSIRDVILELIEAGDSGELSSRTSEMHSADIAEILNWLEEPEQKLFLYRLLDVEVASDVLADVSEATREILLENLRDEQVAEVIEHLDTDDATDVVADLPEERQETVLHQADPEIRKEVEDLLHYPEDTAGGIMKKEIAAVMVGATVSETVEYIRSRAEIFHDIHNVFVIDHSGHLKGLVSLRRLLLAEPGTQIAAIMDEDFVSVRVDVDQEETAHLFEKYDLLSMPVVDSLGRLVGRITVDDIVDVIAEEATEDILALGGLGSEAAQPVTAGSAIRARFPWLGLNLLTAAAGTLTVALFESTIRNLAIAAALMNIVVIQGGNAGIQTMTLVVRGLALGEVESRDAMRILGRECLTALGNGLLLGMISAVFVYFWKANLALSLVLGSSLLINLLVAATLGSLVPLTLKALRVDPAVSSTVLVTAGTDILGFFIFLGLLTLAI